jgi:hypothetical protein
MILLYAGSVIIAVWGLAHLFPTRSIVAGFGEIPLENKRILAMSWIAEGLAMTFIGVLVFVLTISGYAEYQAALIVYRLSSLMLLVMAIISFFTGFRTSIIPMRICPFVKIISAALIIAGSGY